MRRIRIIIMMALTVALLFLLSAVTPAGATPPLPQASGSGVFYTPPGGGKIYGYEFLFAFNARLLNDAGNAEGHFVYHNLTNLSVLQMKITYMEFEGNDVWMIGEVTLSEGTNAEVGDERAVRLQDNGEGKNARPDKCSKLSKDYIIPGDLNEDNFPLIELDGGDVLIRNQRRQ